MTRQVGIIWTNNGFILICKVLRPFRQDILRACSEYGIFFFCSYVFFCEIELIYVKFLCNSLKFPRSKQSLEEKEKRIQLAVAAHPCPCLYIPDALRPDVLVLVLAQHRNHRTEHAP